MMSARQKLIIGIMLGMMVMIGCGDDDKPKAGICEMCNQDSNCEPDFECKELYDLNTWLPVGEYCIDSPTRVCEIGGEEFEALCQAACEKLEACNLFPLPGSDGPQNLGECYVMCEVEDYDEEMLNCILENSCIEIPAACLQKSEVSGLCWTGVCPEGWESAGEECVYTAGPTTTFSGVLLEFGIPGEQPVEDALVQVYNNYTGDKIPVCALSGAGGAVSLEGIPADMEKVGIKASKENYKDTYQFNLANSTTDETLWIISEVLYALVSTMAGVVVDPTKGMVTGALYFINEADEEEKVGCATITSDKGGDIRYFDEGGLPTTLVNRDRTHPSNGYFLAGNVPEGSTTITAWVDGTEVGDVSIFTFADSMCISNIYVYYDAVTNPVNPTPAGCE